MPIHTGNIQFPATAVDNSNVNTLDDYEEGDWTPEIRGTTTNPSAAVTAAGKYTKIGRIVKVDFYISFAASATPGSGSAVLYGLPFNVSGSGYQGHQGIIAYGNYFGIANSGAPRFLYAVQGSATAYLKVADSDIDNKTIYPTNAFSAADIAYYNAANYFSGNLTYRTSD